MKKERFLPKPTVFNTQLEGLMSNYDENHHLFAVSLKDITNDQQAMVSYFRTTYNRPIPFYELKISRILNDFRFEYYVNDFIARGLAEKRHIKETHSQSTEDIPALVISDANRDELKFLEEQHIWLKQEKMSSEESAAEIIQSALKYRTYQSRHSNNQVNRLLAEKFLYFLNYNNLVTDDDIAMLVSRCRIASVIKPLDKHPLFPNPEYFKAVKKTYIGQGIYGLELMDQILEFIEPDDLIRKIQNQLKEQAGILRQ